MIEPGTLQDLLDSVQANSTVARNVLDLPLGKSAVPIPPMFADISTDAYSVPYVKHLVKVLDLRDVLSWGTAATIDALSWFHVDDDGFGTAVYVLAGGKWWVLAERLPGNVKDDMSDIRAFNGWGVRNIDPKLWTLEAVLLRPNSVL